MGTEVHCRSYLLGYYSMRDLNEDSISNNWSMFYSDPAVANGQYCNGFLPSTVTSYSGYEKYALKQTMLEHEAIFKRQVFELHRLYKIQRDMMDEIKRKELCDHLIPIETSSSSSRLASDMPSEDAQKRQKKPFALSFGEGNNIPIGRVPSENASSSNSKDCEILESRPSKVRRQLFDLQLPADEYIDFEEGGQYPCTNNKIASGSIVKFSKSGRVKTSCNGDASRSSSCLKSSVGLADLNEPIQLEEATLPSPVDFIGSVPGPGEIKDLDLAAQKRQKKTFALSFGEGNNIPTGRVPFENASSSNSKDCEILESRPSKVRRQLFDLQLPADECIDFEEGRQYPCTNNKIASGSIVKFSKSGRVKTGCNGDASRCSSCLKSSVGLADLNEPIQVEEATLPSPVDFIGSVPGPGETKDLDLAAQRKPQFLLGLPKENLLNGGSSNGSSVNTHVEGKGHGRDRLSYCYKAGHHQSHLNSFSDDVRPEKFPSSSLLKHAMLNRAHPAVGFLPSDHIREDQWRERTVHGLEISEQSQDLFNFNRVDSAMASHIPDQHPFLHSSGLDSGWIHSISTLGNCSSNLTQKLTSVQTHPPLNSLGSLSKNFLPSAQTLKILGDKWQSHTSSGSSPAFVSGLSDCNGFYHGSASGSKDLASHFPSIGLDYLNCNKEVKEASERLINYSTRSYLVGSKGADLSVKDMNLNAVLPKFSSNGLEIMDEERKYEGHLKVLPWLSSKPTCKIDPTIKGRDSNSSELSFLQAASNHLSFKSEIVKGNDHLLTPNITLASYDDHDVRSRRIGGSDCLAKRKVLGFPFSDNPCTPNNDSSSLISTSASFQCTEHEEDIVRKGVKIGLIDINLACEPECDTLIAADVLVIQKEKNIKQVANLRGHIDLNSSLDEDEVTLVPSIASTGVDVKIAVEIDLEAPAFPETEEEGTAPAEEQQHEIPSELPLHKAELLEDEISRMAAEALVDISSSVLACCIGKTSYPYEGPRADSLLWFVEVVSSFADESKGYEDVGDKESSSCDEVDYFEALTLNLTEVKEEEYMPKPLVLENQNLEETGTGILPSRLRRGQARRGRPRRDFQRDILPGLASLSRLEVTEDLQTFGGLMKATGHVWNSGLTRRNGTRSGGARGRRRSVVVVDHEPAVAPIGTICIPLMQQLNSIEVGLEDRSLTGWGKTPRRPRRQRCPTGILPPSIALT